MACKQVLVRKIFVRIVSYSTASCCAIGLVKLFGALMLANASASEPNPGFPAEQPSATQSAVNCLVVCPTDFRESIKPWVDYRSKQGIVVRLVESGRSAADVKRQLVESGLGEKTAAVLLVGDCVITSAYDADPRKQVPTHYRQPGPTAKFGTTASLAGDAPYGDLDGDGVPEVSVGRLPVDTPKQLSDVISRIIAYETSSDFGDWRDTIQITAGVGGFGFLADAAIESATRSVLTTTVPNSTRFSVTYCSPSSDFNPGPNDFFPCVLRRYKEGGLFWVYLGHGQITELDRVPGPGGSRRPVLDRDDVALLERPASAAPIAVMLACYTGAFDATVDSLAEQMVLAEGGPIAVLAGSRVTMPYGNAIAAQGLINAVYEQKAAWLGQAWLTAQRELATDASQSPDLAKRRKMVDMLATAVSPSADLLPEERLEHVHLYNLFGDPLLMLRHPGEVVLDIPRSVVSGQPIMIRGIAPHAGDLSVSVRHLPGNAPIDRTASRIEQYEQANDGQVAQLLVENQSSGPFQATMVMPENIKGPVHVIARIQNHVQWSIGAQRLLVRPQ